MKKYDEEAAGVLQQWTEKEVRTVIGASSSCSVPEDNEYHPRGPHRWFPEAVADISAIIAMRRMSEVWKERPPYSSWRSCAPAIRHRADEMVLAAGLLPGITLAQWFNENEPLLQKDPTMLERTTVVAVALLPIFEQEPDCWQAMDWLDDDTRGTFADYLKDWHARVPEKHRPFVREVAGKFGIEIESRV